MANRFVILDCQNCGGALQIGASVSRLTCGCCGRTQRVIRKSEAISLKLMDSPAKVSQSAGRATAKLAIRKHTQDLKQAYARKHQVESEGEERVKALRRRFKKRALRAVAAPLFFAAVLIGAGSQLWPSAPEGDLSLCIGGLIASGVVVAAIFFFGWPAFLDQIDTAKRATQKALSDLDGRIGESQAAITHNQQIANAKGRR
jgi:hypothetical protein